MRVGIYFSTVLVLLDIWAPAMLGAVPLQGGVSPRTHNADYFLDRIYWGLILRREALKSLLVSTIAAYLKPK